MAISSRQIKIYSHEADKWARLRAQEAYVTMYGELPENVEDFVFEKTENGDYILTVYETVL